tara:strand:- start:5395 stop:6510 length:1116 start_codon:yes stop_codon:yes gene_type:complete
MDSKKKILFILHIPPPVHGSSIVGKQIMDSKLINSYFDTEYINLGTSKKVSDIGGLGFKKIISYAKILFLVLKKLTTNKYDSVYLAPTISNLGFYKDLPVALIIQIFNKKNLYHLHNKGVSNRNKNSVTNFLHRLFFRNTTIILLSKLLYKDVAEFVSEENIYICPNGVGVISNLDKELQDKPVNKVVTILFLSNLIQSKGVLVLLDACKILNEKGVAFKCLFVGGEGDITEDEFINKIESYKLNDKVYYLGKKYDKEKHNVFLNADIFAFPTFYYNECFPLVTLEAMQYALPIISSNEGGIPDIVKNDFNGFIVPRKKSAELAKKMITLIKDEELRKTLGKNGREMFLNEYTSEKFEAKLLEILIKIAEK